MEINFISIVIYFTLLIITIFVSFYIIRGLYFITLAPPFNFILGPVIAYTLTTKQPVMIPPNYMYILINLPILHNIYIGYLCFVAAVLAFTVLFWLIFIVIQRMFLLSQHPLRNVNFLIFFWKDLNDLGFFEWLLEKTLIDKNKDVINFILNIFRAFLTPEEFETAQKRCLENFISSAPKTPDYNPSTNPLFKLPLPHKEYIDYDLKKDYDEDRLDDKFYTDSYKSIIHREAANNYRNMVILRPDTVNDFVLPEYDIEGTININKSYIYI
jgi:hypothetical protein